MILEVAQLVARSLALSLSLSLSVEKRREERGRCAEAEAEAEARGSTQIARGEENYEGPVSSLVASYCLLNFFPPTRLLNNH